MSTNLVLRMLALGHRVSEKAGKIIRNVHSSGDLKIIEKSIGNYQTEADRLAERCIVASYRKHFPTIQVIGEEGESDFQSIPDDFIVDQFSTEVLSKVCPQRYANFDPKDVTIWVDPLDGTYAFVQGELEQVTVLIGIAIKEEAVAGIIHSPFTGKTVWGLKELGVFGLEFKPPPEQGRIFIISKQPKQELLDILDAVGCTDTIEILGCGYGNIHILEGNAHGALSLGKAGKKWDICASNAIISASKSFVYTDQNGGTFKFQRGADLNVSNGVFALHTSVDLKEIVNRMSHLVNYKIK